MGLLRLPVGLRCLHADDDAATDPPLADPSQPDIIEEALDLFRANCLFRNFEIKGAGVEANVS